MNAQNVAVYTLHSKYMNTTLTNTLNNCFDPVCMFYRREQIAECSLNTGQCIKTVNATEFDKCAAIFI